MASSVKVPIIMTGNNTPSPFVISTSSQASGFDPYKALDGILYSGSGSVTGWLASSRAAWWKIDMGESKVLTKLALFAVNATGGGANLDRMPRSWTFEGSNTGSFSGEHEVLINISGDSPYSHLEKRVFNIDSPKKFKFYRINVTTNMDGSTFTGIPELEFYELAYDLYILIKNQNSYFKYKDNIWNLVTNQSPTESDYTLGNALTDISTIPESAWSELTGEVELCYYTDDPTKTDAQFNIETTPFTLAEEWEDKTIKVIEYTDNPNQTESTITLETEPFTLYDELGDTVDVLYYTDDTSKTSASLSVTANYSPLDEINGDFEVVTWTDNDIEVGSEPTLTYEALPFEQLLLQPQDFKVHGTIKSIVATKIAQTSEGKLRFIASFDSGATWKTYRFGKWKLINHNDLSMISKKGMTIDTLNTIPEKDLIGLTRIGYYLDNSIHNSVEKTQLDVVKTIQLAPTQDVKFSDVAFYLLNTTATIQLQLQGNKLVGTLDDADQTRVQYRVILNGNPYYPLNGEFSPLMPSPLNIQLNLSEKDVVFGQDNTLKVEFQDYWGQVDSWQTTFVGTYSGIMFKDEAGKFYSNSFGEILKRLEFGNLFAGQTTLEQKVIVKNQLGVKVQNLLLEIVKEKLPPGVSIELSRSNFPFTPEDPLLFNMFFDVDQEFEFYVRIVTQLTAPTAANGQFEIRAKADPV